MSRRLLPCLVGMCIADLPACSLHSGGLGEPDAPVDLPSRDDGAGGEVAADADARFDAETGADAEFAPEDLPDEMPPDVPPEDAATGDDVSPDAELDGTHDASSGEDASREDAADAADEAAPADVGPEDAPLEIEPACGGVRVGGFCWYAGGVNESCTSACAAHGGCDLAGTREFAGSGGSDANCVAVLEALGFGAYSHQNWSNNDLGCHFAWRSWTYWSNAFPTTCDAHYPGAAAEVVRMCACFE